MVRAVSPERVAGSCHSGSATAAPCRSKLVRNVPSLSLLSDMPVTGRRLREMRKARRRAHPGAGKTRPELEAGHSTDSQGRGPARTLRGAFPEPDRKKEKWRGDQAAYGWNSGQTVREHTPVHQIGHARDVSRGHDARTKRHNTGACVIGGGRPMHRWSIETSVTRPPRNQVAREVRVDRNARGPS